MKHEKTIDISLSVTYYNYNFMKYEVFEGGEDLDRAEGKEIP